MTSPTAPLPVSVLRQIDSTCDRFETDWKAGKQPRIENYLGNTSEPHRSALLQRLLQLELELLGRQQLRPDAGAYRARFPQHASLVDAVVQSAVQRTAAYQPQQASADTSVSRSSVPAAPAPAPVKPAPAPMPKQIGRFQILDRLGQGAFGQVFRARDPQLDREVALKVPLPGVLATEQDVERFLREARAAATIHHPNVCPVFEVGQHQREYFIVMALLKGQSLAHNLKARKEPFPAKQIALMVRKLAQALEAAHGKGVIHRDLKPANIMLDFDRRDVVIMDFGLARRGSGGDAMQTRQGTLLGSPAYMSPEQARGDVQAIGPHSDIYSLGVVLYELLTGQLPFTGTVAEVLGKVQHVAPDPPSRVRPGVDPALEAICLKAMAKAPAQRFASMKEMGEAVGRYLKDASASAAAAPALAVPPPALQPVGLSTSQRADTQAAVEAAVQRSTRGLWKIALFAGVPTLALGGILAVVLLLQSMKEPEVPGNNNFIDNSITRNTVTVVLQYLPHLNDPLVIYVLDGKEVPAEKLTGKLTLEIGKHELVIKKEGKVIEERHFEVGEAKHLPKDEPQQIVPPLAEPKGPIGLVHKFVTPFFVSGVAISLDGRRVLAAGSENGNGGTQGFVYCWQIKEAEKAPEKFAFLGAAKVAFDPRGGKAAFSNHWNGNPAFVQFWSLDPWKDLVSAQISPGQSAQCLQYSSDGKYLLGGWSVENNQHNLVILDPDTSSKVASFPSFIACFAPDSKHIFIPTATKDNELDLVEVVTKKTLRTYKGHSARIYCVACSPGGKYVAAGTAAPAHAIRVWEVDSGKEVGAFMGHTGLIQSLAFSPDGRRLLSGSADTTVRLWDITSGKEVPTTFKKDNGSKEEFSPFKHDNSVYEVCFTPGGNRALSCSADGTVRLWQLPE